MGGGGAVWKLHCGAWLGALSSFACSRALGLSLSHAPHQPVVRATSAGARLSLRQCYSRASAFFNILQHNSTSSSNRGCSCSPSLLLRSLKRGALLSAPLGSLVRFLWFVPPTGWRWLVGWLSLCSCVRALFENSYKMFIEVSGTPQRLNVDS